MTRAMVTINKVWPWIKRRARGGAQADGMAMNLGRPAAKEAATHLELDSDPTKLIGVAVVAMHALISRICIVHGQD